ncbi:hypothetical protein [Leucobacter chromiireducens]|uniref:hypothetical protein n=1 Tax=Leucobacter chromiireducens TaxID=283877 RepID=UPI000F637633|nr:hypothetical protein [Leucobacter chromiireducens]
MLTWNGPEFSGDAAPRRDPLSYPGAVPAASVLITQHDVWRILDRWNDHLAWNAATEQRLGSCRVAIDERAANELGLSHRVPPTLNSVLEELTGAIADSLVPVIAIGSNAAPAQLRNKFASETTQLVIPSIRARISGYRVGFTSFLAPAGYLPATMFPEAGAETAVTVQFVSRGQLRAIDATESPWYRRVWVDDAQILLETGERLPGAYVYVAEHGALGDERGPFILGGAEPGLAASDHTEPASVAARRLHTQERALETLLSDRACADAWGTTPAELLAAAPGAQASLDVVQRSGHTLHRNTLAERADEIGAEARRYGLPFPQRAPSRRADTEALSVTVGRTHDLLERNGNSVVRLGDRVRAALGDPAEVELVSEALHLGVAGRAPRVIASVYRSERDDAPSADPDVIEVDHMLRMGAGLEVGERALLRPVSIERRELFDVVLGTPNYVSFRVTLADPSSTEREVCLMSELSLQLLGISSGDYVVLEGAADHSGRVRTLVVKAFQLPEDVWQERVRVSNGSWDDRFPGARSTLGIHPDIPTLFVDAATRARLGLGAQQLAVVRARPARLQQFGNEVRDMLLLLAIAFIGIVGIIPNLWVGAGLFGLLLVGSFALMLVKLRRRLSHRAAGAHRSSG